MSIKPINDHYAFTATGTIYDEEAMTALELAARTARKVNECVEAINNHNRECSEKIEHALTVDLQKNVDKWLEQHPEASTTVQDKSIETSKLTDNAALELANIDYNVKLSGAVGDGITDDSDAIQYAMLVSRTTGRTIHFPKGTYKVTKTINVLTSLVFDKNAVIEFYPSKAGESCLHVKGTKTSLFSDRPCKTTDRSIAFTGGAGNLKAGDYIYISSTDKVSPFARDYDTKGEILQVEGVSSNVVTFTIAPVYDYTRATVAKYNYTSVDQLSIDGANVKCMDNTYSDTYGLTVSNAKNVTVRNCSISGFDYSQIQLTECTLCDVHSNLCEIDYSNELQYGIVASRCQDVVIHGNKVNSARTAIDVTGVSNKVVVTNNVVKGNINTHSATNVTLSDNTISDGAILIRGKNVNVLGNNVTNHSMYCIDIEEMGIEGGHIISNNTFNGWCSMKVYQSGIMILNNRFNVSKVSEYESDAESTRASVFRIMTVDPDPTAGLVIRGNWIDYQSATKPSTSNFFCVDTQFNCNTLYNVTCSDNVIKGFTVPLNFVQRTADLGENLIIKGNLLFECEVGIQHRHVNNTQITGNTIVANNTGKTGGCGILRIPTTFETQGLIISDNVIRDFMQGHAIQGSGNILNVVYFNNVYIGCQTDSSGISGNSTRVPNELFVATGTNIYQIKVDANGEVVAQLQSVPV